MIRYLNFQKIKKWKNTESICISILTINFDMFTAAKFFFSARFLNICKPGTTFYFMRWVGLPEFELYESGPGHLPGWLGMVKAGWIGSMWSEIFSQMKFIVFPRCPTYLASQLHIISSLFSDFCLFQNIFFFSCGLSWYLHLKLFNEGLTFISFNIWR